MGRCFGERQQHPPLSDQGGQAVIAQSCWFSINELGKAGECDKMIGTKHKNSLGQSFALNFSFSSWLDRQPLQFFSKDRICDGKIIDYGFGELI